MQQSTIPSYLTKMGIKTDPHPSYSADLATCDFWSFSKLRGFRYETIEGMKEAHTRGLPWDLAEVVGTVQVHCNRRRLLRTVLEFHVCSINKSAHRKKSGNLFNAHRNT